MKSFLRILLCLILFGCNQAKSKPTNTKKTKFDCNSALSKKAIYYLADSLISKTTSDDIWNLSDVDTANIFTIEDFFTDSVIKNQLVLIQGSAGMSAGTADHLLILFACTDSLKIVWAGQVGAFKEEDIRDLNNDGIKEITCATESVWMGECTRSFTIFNFKNEKHKILYSAYSSSFVGCGYDNLDDFEEGDTLETEINSSILHKDKQNMVQQVRTIKVHNGGDSTEAIIDNAQLHIDTTLIQL